LPPAPFDRKFGEPRRRRNEFIEHNLRWSSRRDWYTRPESEIVAERDDRSRVWDSAR
jgi:hypothetical protein